jgi:hypothetical protein
MQIYTEPLFLTTAVRGKLIDVRTVHGINRGLDTIVDPDFQTPAREAPKPSVSIETKPLDIRGQRGELKSSARVTNHQSGILRKGQKATARAPSYPDETEPAKPEDFGTFVLIFQHDGDARLVPVGAGPGDGEGTSSIRRRGLDREKIRQDI